MSSLKTGCVGDILECSVRRDLSRVERSVSFSRWEEDCVFARSRRSSNPIAKTETRL